MVEFVQALEQCLNVSVSLQLGEPLYLDGIPDIVIGCIRNLRISPTNELVNFVVDSLDGLNITKCPSMHMDTCANQPCINGGTSCCVQEVNELFTCHAYVLIAILE